MIIREIFIDDIRRKHGNINYNSKVGNVTKCHFEKRRHGEFYVKKVKINLKIANEC